MYRVVVSISMFLILACSDPTGPSFLQYSLVSVIETSTGSIIANIELSPAFSETGNELYISDYTQLICLDPDTDKEIASADLGKMITDICIVPGSNTMYVSWETLWVEGGVIALDRTTLAVTNSIDLAFEVDNLCYVPVLDILYVGYRADFHDDRIMVVDLPGLDPLDDIQINPNLVNMVSDPSGDHVYCNIYMDNRTGS